MPAYDTAGGPPKYIDIELGFLGAGQTGGRGPVSPVVGVGTEVGRQSGEPDRASGTRHGADRSPNVENPPPSTGARGLLVESPPMTGVSPGSGS